MPPGEEWSGDQSQISWASARFCDSVTNFTAVREVLHSNYQSCNLISLYHFLVAITLGTPHSVHWLPERQLSNLNLSEPHTGPKARLVTHWWSRVVRWAARCTPAAATRTSPGLCGCEPTSSSSYPSHWKAGCAGEV